MDWVHRQTVLALGVSGRKPPRIAEYRDQTAIGSSVEKHPRCCGRRLSGRPLSTLRKKGPVSAELRLYRGGDSSRDIVKTTLGRFGQGLVLGLYDTQRSKRLFYDAAAAAAV
jgi:hypothetical protein